MNWETHRREEREQTIEEDHAGFTEPMFTPRVHMHRAGMRRLLCTQRTLASPRRSEAAGGDGYFCLSLFRRFRPRRPHRPHCHAVPDVVLDGRLFVFGPESRFEHKVQWVNAVSAPHPDCI
jgi:hypothetical protein